MLFAKKYCFKYLILFAMLFLFIVSSARLFAATGIMLPDQVIEDEPINMQRYKENLAGAGITFKLNDDDETLDINIIKNEVMTAVPGMIKNRMMPELKADATSTMGTWISVVVVGLPLTINILKTVYHHDVSLDKLKVHVYIFPGDGSAKQSCYYFDCSRELIDKLAGAGVRSTPQYLLDNTPGFIMDAYCNETIKNEMQ